jgi:hypothetical protein
MWPLAILPHCEFDKSQTVFWSGSLLSSGEITDSHFYITTWNYRETEYFPKKSQCYRPLCNNRPPVHHHTTQIPGEILSRQKNANFAHRHAKVRLLNQLNRKSDSSSYDRKSHPHFTSLHLCNFFTPFSRWSSVYIPLIRTTFFNLSLKLVHSTADQDIRDEIRKKKKKKRQKQDSNTTFLIMIRNRSFPIIPSSIRRRGSLQIQTDPGRQKFERCAAELQEKKKKKIIRKK